ncbi:Medium subunit of clathrin adaptor complex [Trachipleistophora hominis]|uniref:Coatomer subunit delta n=1 Tax=Trachipleistophora hominis TaxID=72359 RepID=L7JV58_TRAHO|nr:Medium subunit of clathrin adaptor complex [Trachipleistophora hominis]
MIVCSFVQHNQNIIFRPVHKITQGAFETLLLTFNTTKKNDEGVIKTHSLNIYYATQDALTCAVIASKKCYENDMYAILKAVMGSITCFSSLEDVVGAFDDVVNEYTYFRLSSDNLRVIREMDSYEEKVHKMVAKNKEAENEKVMKEISEKVKLMGVKGAVNVQAGGPAVSYPSITVTDPLAGRVPEVHVDTFEKMKDEIRRACRATPSKKVQLLITERLSLVVDKEGNKKSGEITGDMTMYIKDERFKDISIEIRAPHPVKYSPNLQKDSAKKKVLKAKKSFPVKKCVALVKWTRNADTSDFTFNLWLTKNEGKLNVMMDYEKREDLQEIAFRFNTKGSELSNGHCREAVVWRSKHHQDNIEFVAERPVFPINVYFCGTRACMVGVEKIVMDDEAVDDYEVEYCYEGENVQIVD